MKRVLCCMLAAMMVFSALSPALADSSMLDAELSGRIGAKVNSYRDMADAPKSDVIVFSPAAPITIQGMYVCISEDMQTGLPISEYDDNFLDSDLGGYFRRVIENY